jgi:hypothetical protein
VRDAFTEGAPLLRVAAADDLGTPHISEFSWITVCLAAAVLAVAADAALSQTDGR